MLTGRIEEVKAVEDTELLKLAEILAKALQNTAEGRDALKTTNIKVANSQVGVNGDSANINGGIHMGETKE